MAHVLIATPTATSQVLQAYVQTLIKTRQHLTANGVANEYVSIAFSEVHTARNVLAAQFLVNTKATHLFFVDSDMSLPAALCHELLATKKDLIGAAYPKRILDLKKLEENLSKTAGNFQDALSLTYEFAVRTTRRQNFQNGLLSVRGVGMGATLIARRVFEKMIEAGCAPKLKSSEIFGAMGLEDFAYDFFGALRLPDDQVLSEDYSFCERWITECNGEVWAAVDKDIGHIGEMRHAASYSRRLELQAAAKSPRLVVSLGNSPGSPPKID